MERSSIVIGVWCEQHERETAQEFFELFKTPWEYFTPGHSYSTVISTSVESFPVAAPLLVVYGAGERPVDRLLGMVAGPRDSTGPEIVVGERTLPIYCGLAPCSGGKPLLTTRGSRDSAAVEHIGSNVRTIRVGYDLFAETRYLLTHGQPANHAMIPSLELHIDLLRGWMLDSGIPLVEIPPVPEGYGMTVCLSHDVDFIRLRHHAMDRTMLGFAYRASVGSLNRALAGEIPWSRARKNWGAFLKTPLVLLGAARDPWLEFERYMELERETPSTFFLIPLSKRRAAGIYPEAAVRRTSRYDIDDVVPFIRPLRERGFEVGVHGLEAWSGVGNARREHDRTSRHTGAGKLGIRMHYLMFDADSPRVLEAAGYDYDSTFGYNETPGFRAGTGQAFRFPGTEQLIELPMLIMDTALFSSRRMRLTEAQAWKYCCRILRDIDRFGGALTVNWHMRSLAPERLWESFYRRLLGEIRSRNPWFGTAAAVTAWFRKRRAARFSEIRTEAGQTLVGLDTVEDGLPPLALTLRYREHPESPIRTISRPAVPFTVFPVRGDAPEFTAPSPLLS